MMLAMVVTKKIVDNVSFISFHLLRLLGMVLPLHSGVDQRRKDWRKFAALLPRQLHLAHGRATQDQDPREVRNQGKNKNIKQLITDVFFCGLNTGAT